MINNNYIFHFRFKMIIDLSMKKYYKKIRLTTLIYRHKNTSIL